LSDNFHVYVLIYVEVDIYLGRFSLVYPLILIKETDIANKYR